MFAIILMTIAIIATIIVPPVVATIIIKDIRAGRAHAATMRNILDGMKR